MVQQIRLGIVMGGEDKPSIGRRRSDASLDVLLRRPPHAPDQTDVAVEFAYEQSRERDRRREGRPPAPAGQAPRVRRRTQQSHDADKAELPGLGLKGHAMDLDPGRGQDVGEIVGRTRELDAAVFPRPARQMPKQLFPRRHFHPVLVSPGNGAPAQPARPRGRRRFEQVRGRFGVRRQVAGRPGNPPMVSCRRP